MPAVNEAGGVAAESGGVTADGGVKADGGVSAVMLRPTAGGVSAVMLRIAAGGLAADGGLAAEETSPQVMDPVRIR